jgi:hypothetical protein
MDFPMDFPQTWGSFHGFPRILPRQIPWSCCFSSSQVVTVKPRVSCAAAHFFCPESLRRWGWIPKHRRWISESGWWFGTFFIFHNIWNNPSHWLFFSRWLKPPIRNAFKSFPNSSPNSSPSSSMWD